MSAFLISLRRLLFVAALTVAGLPGIAEALQIGVGWTLAGNGRDVAIDVPAVFGTRSAAVAGISDRVLSVWKWDAVNQQWAFFTPSMDVSEIATYAAGKGYAVLKTIFPGEGYWINANAAAILNTPSGQIFTHNPWQLASGWNLFATGTNASPPGFHASIAPFTATSLWAWNATQQNWYFFAPSLAANSSLAAYIQQKGYLDFGNVTFADGVGFWVNRAPIQGSPTAGLAPLDQAKQMFAQLRATFHSFSNVSGTGALDAALVLMRGNVTQAGKATQDIFEELQALSAGVNLYVAAKNRQFSGYTVVPGTSGTSVVSAVYNQASVANPAIHAVGFRSYVCSTTVANTGTSAPTPVSCSVFGSYATGNSEPFVKFTIAENSTDNYAVTAQLWATSPNSAVGTAYTGTLVTTKDVNGVAQSFAFALDLPALTTGYDKYNASLNINRALQTAGTPNATYRYAMTGSIVATAQGASAFTYAFDNGSYVDHIEDSLGQAVGTNPVQEIKLVGRTQTATARYDGTVDAKSFAVNADGTNSAPTSISVGGSLADTSPGGPGRILNVTGTIAISNYAGYHSAQPDSRTNYIQGTMLLSGTLQLPSRPLLGLTFSMDTVGPNSQTFSGQYSDSNGTTVSFSGTHASAKTTVFPFSSINSSVWTFANQDGVVVTLSGGPNDTITKGGTTLGQITGGTIYYTDGVFESLQ